MHNAKLHLGSRNDRLQGVGQPRQPIHAGHETICDAPLLELCEDGQPKLRAFRFTQPEASQFLFPGERDAEGDIDGFRLDSSFVPRLHE